MVLLLAFAPAPGVYALNASVVAVAEHVACTVSVTAKVVVVVAEPATPAQAAPKISVIA
jgi:hypothetical protein